MRIHSIRSVGLLALVLTIALGAQGCGGGGDTEPGLQIKLCGAPLAEYPDLDPFKDCYFVKICHRTSDSQQPKNCVEFEFATDSGDAEVAPLPYDQEVVIVAECLANDTTAPSPEPGVLISRGESIPITQKKGDVIREVTIYMVKPSSFAPTFSFGDGFDCTANRTSTFSERWGATATEMYDGSILIAGGVDDYNTKFDTAPCDDWSKPACVEKATATAEFYDPGTGEFTLFNSGASLMTEKRAFGAAVRLPSEEIAIFGGITAGGEPTNTVDIYNPITYTFQAVPEEFKMEYTRAYHTATLISSSDGGYVLLVGGFGTGDGTWEVWTPAQGRIASGTLQESRWHHTATLVSKSLDPNIKRNMVVIVGGEGGGDPGATSVRDTLEIFDIDATSLDEMAYPLCTNLAEKSPVAAKKTMHATAFVPKRHFLYIAGGFKDAKHLEPTKDICVWHTTQEKWSGEAGTFMLKKSRGAITATALPGNAVLFAGGLTKKDGSLQNVDTVEIVFEYYNAKGETVVDIGPDYPINMHWPRWGHGAVLTNDGKVLIYGGLGSSPASPQMLKETEVFNPQI